MSSKPRISVPGHIYEVTSIGVDKLRMFEKAEMRVLFLETLKKYLRKFKMSCYTYSFTCDQYTLVLRSSEQPIWLFMQQLNSNFAKKYNRFNNHKHAVFGKRYDSIIARDDIGLTELVRYVNLEPVSQNLCTLEDLDYSDLSGHSIIIGKTENKLLEIEEILRTFSSDDPIQSYQEYIKKFKPHEGEVSMYYKIIDDAHHGKVNQPILGPPEYIEIVKLLNRNRHSTIPRNLKEHVTLHKIQSHVEAMYNLNKNELFLAGRKNIRAKAREFFAYIARFRFDFKNAEIAKFLGVCNSSISKMLNRIIIDSENEILLQKYESTTAHECIIVV